jgi:hypothetical protein
MPLMKRHNAKKPTHLPAIAAKALTHLRRCKVAGSEHDSGVAADAWFWFLMVIVRFHFPERLVPLALVTSHSICFGNSTIGICRSESFSKRIPKPNSSQIRLGAIFAVYLF